MKTYHGMCKYRQINFFPNVVKDVRPTYGNKEELAPLNIETWIKNHEFFDRFRIRALECEKINSGCE